MNHDRENFNFDNYDYNMTNYEDRTDRDLIYPARRNLMELIKLINRLFERYSRLLVVRVDLGYRKDIAKQVQLETAQMHREEFFSDKRSQPFVFEGLVGYAWGLEYGELEGGYHYHLLMIYNSALRRDDVGIGMAIRDLWDQITVGNSHCYISNFDKDRFAAEGSLGIGMIHRDDVPIRINLIEKVAAYISKKCTHFDIQSERTSSGEFRTFGKSWMPKPIDQSMPRRGRPIANGRGGFGEL